MIVISRVRSGGGGTQLSYLTYEYSLVLWIAINYVEINYVAEGSSLFIVYLFAPARRIMVSRLPATVERKTVLDFY